MIKNGLVIDPKNKVQSKLNLLIEDGKIAKIARDCPEADRVIDACGKIVTAGFIDIHMHEDPVVGGKIVNTDATAIQNCMLRMGVTTAIGGQCGISDCHPADYLDIVDRDGASVNIGMLVGHAHFREMAGCDDKYANISDEKIEYIADEMQKAVDRGCLGVSYGIRYIPGLDRREMMATAKACVKDDKFIAAHVRDDAAGIFDATRELISVGEELGIPVQVSHIGSMAGFGQMSEFLDMIAEYNMNGVRVSCDCYPYYAFSTEIGATTYDDGWLERYQCGYDVIEMCEGKYKGQRCTKETFEEMRRDFPECITVCYVMQSDDVDFALTHPSVMLGSDGIMNMGQGHPRAAGSFARLIAEFVKTDKISMYDAIAMMTSMPAEKLRLPNKGCLNVGADADVVIFDPVAICDMATFAEPTLPAVGIDYVLIGGEIAAQNGKVIRTDLGKSVRN